MLDVRRSKRFPSYLLVFLLPSVIIYSLVMIWPLFDSLLLSFFTATPDNREIWNGLGNYKALLTDTSWAPRFWGAFKNNLAFFAINMLVQNPIALLLAALLVTKGRAKGLFRTILFLPTVLSVVIIGFIWQLILSPLWGVAPSVMKALGIGQLFRPWLGLPGSALVTVSLISVWQFIGIPMILFYTALIGIPDDIIEAAVVDGSTQWGIFWRIKFPLILPTLGIVTMLTFVGNFNAFDLIYTMKGALAGPDFSTDIMGTLFYRTFFGQQLQLGNPTMGATVATMMFLIIMAGVLAYIFLWQRRVKSYQL